MQTLYPWLLLYYQQIVTALLQGHGHHTLLFKAEPDLGIEQLVQAVANFLICQHPNKHQPCGKCHSCHLQQAQNHPDIHILQPLENKDIGIDQVREINDKITLYANQQGNKVVLVKSADCLTEAAANALLKTLEEPTANTYFLLQLNDSNTLPATIYSRCQQWHIATPSVEDSINWLKNQINAEINDILTALRVNYNRPLATLNMLQQNLLEQRKIFLRYFWLFYTRRSPLEILPYFNKENIFQQLDWIISFLVDGLKIKLGVTINLTNTDLQNGVLQFSEKQTSLNLLKAYEIMQKVRLDLTEIKGVNQELILLEGHSPYYGCL